MDIIHHYTSINTLALILANKTIRFNRLDRVDDVSESKAFGDYDLSKYLFVSCWTDSDQESIPQWHIYTNEMTGVRISVRKDLFNYQPLRPDPKWNLVQEGEILSPIPFERLITNEYFILPNIINRKQFERKVQYVDNINEVYKNAVDLKIQPDGKAQLNINRVPDLAGFKNKVWEFQQEFRFVLFILPSIPIPERGLSDERFVSELPTHLLNSILRGIGPSIDYFDVDLAPDALDNITVTLGPLCSEGDRLIVQALLDKHSRNGKIKLSGLTGTVRKPAK